MKRQLISSTVFAAVALTACGVSVVGGNDASSGGRAESEVTKAPEVGPPTTATSPVITDASPVTTDAVPPTTEAATPIGELNINTGGPTVCVDALIDHIGPDAMVYEISSYFEPGAEIEPIDEGDEVPVPGELFICTAQYQDPANPNKLLRIRMDTDTGEFGEPEPEEIDFVPNPTEFDLNDYVIRAADINLTVIQPIIDQEYPALDELYSRWAWSRFSLEPPGPFSDIHLLELRMVGRLASNDLVNYGYLEIAMDGTVVGDYLS